MNRRGFFTLPFLCLFLSVSIDPTTAGDTVTTSEPLADGGATVKSAGNKFILGFFAPGSSKNRYLGIWFAGVSPLTAVWVANRAAPLADDSGVLRLTTNGTLVLLNRTNGVVWTSNASRTPQTTPVAQLLDSGNLVVSDPNGGVLWESFDYPTDTLLPGMKLGKYRNSGPERFLSAWKSLDDPAPGEYTLRVDPNRYAQLVVARNWSELLSLSGPWNGVGFSATPGFRANPYFKFHFIFNETEMFYSYEPIDKSLVTRFVLNQTGQAERLIWNQGWVLYLTVAADNCFRYALCGVYGTCNTNNLPICGCMDRFVPKSQKEWAESNWTRGCERRTPLECGGDGGGGVAGGDTFVLYSGTKLPDTLRSLHNGSMNLDECRRTCTRDCNCTAYATSDISGAGSGCLMWFGDLVDIRYSADNGQDFYVRVAASEKDQGDVKLNNGSKSKKRVTIIASTVTATGLVFLALGFYALKKRQQQQKRVNSNEKKFKNKDTGNKNDTEDFELPIFDYATIAYATDNFSLQNKLGEGGFGPVYKGVMEDGQEIAVKRLSSSSKQGLEEFKNEVVHIAKLQHRNLVKLLGWCIHAEEMILVYEYMPNNSLETLIFDHTKSKSLDWPARFNIINGIARGLLYLHQDSRLRIIHRDLKASNILLDKEMNPKISDFGLARSFKGNETEANTNRVVGTYGYMSPEYAIDGLYSTKSDVFSFGVLALEIVCGKKNRAFSHPDHNLNLLGHAWRLMVEDKSFELIDASIKNSINFSEVARAIHLGLLCVQQYPDDRPSMDFVVLILGSNIPLPSPKQPGFFTERDPHAHGADSSSSNRESHSSNKMSITHLEAR